MLNSHIARNLACLELRLLVASRFAIERGVNKTFRNEIGVQTKLLESALKLGHVPLIICSAVYVEFQLTRRLGSEIINLMLCVANC